MGWLERTDRMLVYGPSKPSSMLLTVVLLSPLLLWLLECERNWMGTRRSISRRAGDVVGNSFFSGEVTLSNSIDDFVKGCYMWTT
jgi:hypothetical protein